MVGPYPFDVNLLVQISRENKVSEIYVFGSMARGSFTDNSDVDLLVKFSSPVGLLHVAHLKDLLSEALGRKVDLVTEQGLSPYIHDEVMKEAILLYRE